MTRNILIAAAAITAMSFQVGSAQAYSSSVQNACMGDYLSYCSHTTPGSTKTASCMRKAGPKLSGRCVKALINAGLVSKSQTKSRSARRH